MDLQAMPPPLRQPARRQAKPERSIESRVFWGVLCALLVFSGLSAVGYAIRVLVVHAVVEQAQQQALQEVQQASQAAQRQEAAQQAYQERWLAFERSRYVLAGNQRCVGGAVIQVDGNAYTQVGSIARPVHCTGNVADRPLR